MGKRCSFDNTLEKAAVADGAFRTPHTYRVLGELFESPLEISFFSTLSPRTRGLLGV